MGIIGRGVMSKYFSVSAVILVAFDVKLGSNYGTAGLADDQLVK
jgi:hypothetical protein